MTDKVARETVGVRKRPPLLVELFSQLLIKKPLGTVGFFITILLFAVGISADWLAPYGYNEINLPARLDAPSAAHPMGTDNLGRDLLSRIIYGARISVIVGLAASVIDNVITVLIGTVSGFLGGKVDIIMQRFVDAFMCVPPLLMYMTIMAVLGPGLLQIILVLGIVGGIRSTRVLRGAVIGIRQNAYIEAAYTIGASTWRIIIKHVLPNVMGIVIVLFTVDIGGKILAEATLSFLGFGIPPPVPSWGGMLSEAGRRYMLLAPWMAFWSGLALATMVFSINMLGDAMRDLLDPRLRGGLGRYGGIRRKII
ncbi:MAG: ABC transporter permease [Chloroflexota bacterium]